MKLTIALATRTRPGMLVRTVEHTLKQITETDTKLVILADSDDDGTLSARSRLQDARVCWSIADKPDSLGEKYNRAMTVAPADVYLVMVDYAPQVVPGFDRKVLDAAAVYPDGYAVVINHLVCMVDKQQPHNHSFSQINAVTHKLAERMGGIYPEYFPYWFVDHWLEEMAKRIGRQVFADIAVDASQRPGTIGLAEPALWGALYTCLEAERAALATAIIDAPDFDDTPARKAALKRNWPLCSEWSIYINSQLQRLDQTEPGPEAEGYHRLRRQATAVIESYLAEMQRKAAA